MDYRDERDALRARIESLEGSLASAQAEVDRLRATEAALYAAQREVQLLKAELARYQAPAGQPKPTKMGPLIVGLTALMAGAFAFAMFARRPTPPTESTPPWTPPPQDTPSTPWQPPKAEPPPEPAPPPPPAPKPELTADVEWKAVVTRAEGAGMPQPGAACVVNAQLTGDGKNADVRDLEVRCGDKILHRSTDKFNGESMTSGDVSETNGKAPSSQQYSITYMDHGSRQGRSQISLDTSQRTLSVWSEGGPAFRVDMRVDELSAPRTGEPLIRAENRVEKIRETAVRTGTIKTIDGTPGLAPGAVCTVDVSPASGSGYNCRVRVRCGGKLIYGDGNSGFNECTVQNGRGEKVNDDRPSSVDQDPRIQVDLSEDSVIVSDDGASPWEVRIGLARAAK